MQKHTSHPDNVIPFPQRDPALAWVARRCRVTSPNVARAVAELAGVRGVDPWIPIGVLAREIVADLRARR